MSAYVTLTTAMVDLECLLQALNLMGFPKSNLVVTDNPIQLQGYEGRQRPEVANVVIPRKHIGPSSNDVGFLATPTGYRLIVSEYDRGRFGQSWLLQVSNHYSTAMTEKKARLEREAREAEIEARRKAEAERIRMEEERRRLIKAQRLAVHEKAKKMGYQIKETREGETLRLVLVKRTY
jgi:hypothetical protein